MIGIFDSGLGGMFLLKELNKKFQKKSFVYLADRKNFPYGEKNSSLVRSLVRKNVDFLASQRVEHIIVACNTASVVLRNEDFYPVPVTGVIEASLKQAKKNSINKKVGLLATVGTVTSQSFITKAEKLNLNLQIHQQACPQLAPFVEQGGWETNNMQNELKNTELHSLLEEYVQPLINKGVDTIIMGCTHYLYLEAAIKKYIGKNKKAVGPLHFLVKDLLEMEKNKQYKQQNQKILTTEKKNNKINVFINGQNKGFEKQLRQIWGTQQNSIQMSIKTIEKI